MSPRLKVKICGMRDTRNVNKIAELGSDFFGLIFYPDSPRYIKIEAAEKLPRFDGTEYIGVFVNGSSEQTSEYARRAGLAAVQLHGDESPAECDRVRSRLPDVAVIKAFAVDREFDGTVLKEYERCCDYFLFDTKTRFRGGCGKSFEWDILRRCAINRPFFLSGGIGPDNVVEAIAACDGLPLYAIDLNSRVEIAPGVKSAALVESVFARIGRRMCK